jgi:protease-4
MRRFLFRFFASIGFIVVLIILISLITMWWTSGERAVPDKVVLELNLERELVEHIPDDPIARLLYKDRIALRDIVDALHRAETDNRVVGVFAHIGSTPMGMAQIQEIRDAIGAFRKTGKFAIAYSETFGEGGPGNGAYYLATAFDQIFLQPSGDVGLSGLRFETAFFRGTLDKLGLVPRLDARSQYKNAKDIFTEKKYTKAHREAMESILNSYFTQMVNGIGQKLGKTPEEVQRLINAGPYLGTEAMTAGLVDGLAYRDEVLKIVRARSGEGAELLYLGKYLDRAGRPNQDGDKAIALIYGVGQVVRGSGGYDSVFGESNMGSATVTAAFRAAIKDENVKAILFRIDSPGGSYVASDTIWHATKQARDAGKPVIISMGNLAASGGYFVSASADKIVAQPGTLTGSIGVVAGKVITPEFWKKLGVTWDAVQRGQNADMWSSLTDYDKEEWQRFQTWLDRVYEDFTNKVATGRNLPLEKVLEIAKGRVWTGAEAKDLGLVDELGGMETALRLARQSAGIAADEAVRIEVLPKRLPTWEQFFEEGPDNSGDLPEAALIRSLKILQPLARQARRSGVLQQPGVLTVPELYQMEVDGF